MLINFQTRRWMRVAAAGIVLQMTVIAQAEGDQPSEPIFKNISFNFEDPAAASPPAPVVDAIPEASGAMQPAPPVYYEMPTASAPCTSCAPSCSCTKCDCKKKKALKKAAATAHKPLFYLNDFSYLNDPCYSGCLAGDSFKQLPFGCGTLDLGGQSRTRFHSEKNHRGLGLTGRSDDFLLQRTRLYADAKMGDVRFFFEMLDANSDSERFNPRPIEENDLDIQNAFVDVTLLNGDSGKLTVRGGRQEIALGAQRYVSPLDWANTRRTFDGGRVMYSNDDWNVDGFWLAPTVRDFNSIDRSNENVAFYGVYSTYKKAKNGTLDLYWLAFDNDIAGFYYDSLGGRYNGKVGDYLMEVEAAYQFGQDTDGGDHDAGFFTTGVGRAMPDHCLKPTTWVYLDWASGAAEQAAGNGHHHFQPLAHKYNGFMDLYGRRNLVDFNILNTMQLSEKVKLLTWYHSFWLENDNDTPYGVTMAPFAAGVTPGDNHLGQELDLVLSVGLSARQNILFGYSYFWAGDYYETPGVPTNRDANFFYTQYTVNF